MLYRQQAKLNSPTQFQKSFRGLFLSPSVSDNDQTGNPGDGDDDDPLGRTSRHSKTQMVAVNKEDDEEEDEEDEDMRLRPA